jgi:hypothetical protein
VDLAEFEGVEVVGEGIVGCVLEVYGNVRCLYGSINVGVDAHLRGNGPLSFVLRTSWRFYYLGCIVFWEAKDWWWSSKLSKMSSVDSSGGWKGVHSGKARPDPGRWFRDSRPPHWSFHHRRASQLHSPPPRKALQHAHLVYYRQDVTTRGADDS